MEAARRPGRPSILEAAPPGVLPAWSASPRRHSNLERRRPASFQPGGDRGWALGSFEIMLCMGNKRATVFSKLTSNKWPRARTLLPGGSGILEQVSSQLKSSLKPIDFKEYEFIYVDHPEIKKFIKLDSRRLDIYDGQANGGIRLANYICAPPKGGNMAVFMYLAERCRDFCAFLLPVTSDQPHRSGNVTKGMVG
ncbi:hypothetical protein CYMTET_10799 [Cymbomonas tetramitiformis]|uniref:Uncharacterized protein n=1 Tax=Cymbomonas tetramitiformis TaxID=36881 RepID=A0AAE0GNG2_9CHLO|nr:hypothetical protein CYMTET_10799 [Cymbomonas tetramitiformis]